MRSLGWFLTLAPPVCLMIAVDQPILGFAVGFVVAFTFGFPVFALGLIILAIRRPEDASRCPCPFCREAIRPHAVICPYCRSAIPRNTEHTEDIEATEDTVRGRWSAYKARYRATLNERRKLKVT